jgi:hypothetical protein
VSPVKNRSRIRVVLPFYLKKATRLFFFRPDLSFNDVIEALADHLKIKPDNILYR